MLSRAARYIDWIECYCHVPDGMRAGEYILMMPFQVEAIYTIYNNNRANGGPTVEGPDTPFEIPDGRGGTLKLTENEILAAEVGGKDREAMMLAMLRCCEESAQREKQIKTMAASRPWQRVGAFASFVCQCNALDLGPHEGPPCHVNDPDNPQEKEQQAAKLLRRMLKAGVSKWHPDPMAALAERSGRDA
jgi:hypothetical protein